MQDTIGPRMKSFMEYNEEPKSNLKESDTEIGITIYLLFIYNVYVKKFNCPEVGYCGQPLIC